MGGRPERVAVLLRAELASLLLRGAKDPRLGGVLPDESFAEGDRIGRLLRGLGGGSP